MDLKYDIGKYVTKTKMSSKKRILVEGRADKSHIKNLLDVLHKGHRVKIDTAENIKGISKETNCNNRAKIDKIHQICKESTDHHNLFFLCDREFLKFEIKDQVTDLMLEHETDGNLSWTLGHSIENYFFRDDLLCEAYRFLCGSEYKSDAEDVFVKVLPSALKLVATITLAAKEIDKSSFPAGVIGWQDFVINDNSVSLDIDSWKSDKNDDIFKNFRIYFNKYLPITYSSDELICSRICRGHTAMLMLQRVFSACLKQVIKEKDTEEKALGDANAFAHLKESNIATALCESWVRKAKEENSLYPFLLIESVV